MSEDTYPMPDHGWTCFHCGETFSIAKQHSAQGAIDAAREHFGYEVTSEPGCLIKLRLGDEQGWLLELRKKDEELRKLYAEREELEHQAGRGQAMEEELARLFDGARTVRAAWYKLEAMEGRALAAEERAGPIK